MTNDFATTVRVSLFLCAAAASGAAGAQSSQPPHAGTGTTITGVVYDSIGHAPLEGATVQLVSADRSSGVARSGVSDSLGRFVLADVPLGNYSVGFFHPVLETLGIDPPLRGISVKSDKAMRLDLGTPGVETYRSAVCGSAYASQPGAILVGAVRDARDFSAVPNATVTAQWMEMTLSKSGTLRKFPTATANTAPNGWFALCDLPSPGTISLVASRGADSLSRLDVDIPSSGVVRKELYFAPSTGVADGHLSGTVLTADGSRPVPGAKVVIDGGPETRTNERGEWTLVGAPYGTRVLQVRAIGFYPERRQVNVIAEAPPVRVALNTMEAVLATVKVTAERLVYDSGFVARKHSGVGRYLTDKDIERRGGVIVSDIFRAIPGMRVERNPLTGEPVISMRGPFGYCDPAVFLNGAHLAGIHAGDINDIVPINQVRGVEIYSEASAPGEFKDFTKMDACGSLVIWTR